MTALYSDLSELPLHNWIEIATSGNLKPLIISGESTDTELQERYAELLGEYQSLIKNEKVINEHSLKVKCYYLANRLNQIEVCLNILRIERDEGIINLLRLPKPDGLGFGRVSYENLPAGIKMTESLMGADKIALKKAQNDIQKLTEAQTDDRKQGVNSKAEFYNEIGVLAKWLQFSINPKECSVMQYVSYLNLLEAEVAANRDKK